MVENENETLRDRVSDLEKRVHDQNDEITCLRATLADALRRINTLEAGKGRNKKNTNSTNCQVLLMLKFLQAKGEFTLAG
jgi:chromosome segregation ATPase